MTRKRLPPDVRQDVGDYILIKHYRWRGWIEWEVLHKDDWDRLGGVVHRFPRKREAMAFISRQVGEG